MVRIVTEVVALVRGDRVLDNLARLTLALIAMTKARSATNIVVLTHRVRFPVSDNCTLGSCLRRAERDQGDPGRPRRGGAQSGAYQAPAGGVCVATISA
jgi:hypothetical protein